MYSDNTCSTVIPNSSGMSCTLTNCNIAFESQTCNSFVDNHANVPNLWFLTGDVCKPVDIPTLTSDSGLTSLLCPALKSFCTTINLPDSYTWMGCTSEKVTFNENL